MIVSHSNYANGWLLHDDKSYYSVIVMHDGFTFVDGLGNKLHSDYMAYCNENITLAKKG